MSEAKGLSAKVWNLAHIMRDQGLSYSDYLEQITMLLFLKMAQENADIGQGSVIPESYSWATLKELRGSALITQYDAILKKLSEEDGLLNLIFEDARNKITTPTLLERVITLLDSEAWSSFGADVKGDLYEGLLERNAQDVKSGAGQYFTPRPLIDAIVSIIDPNIGQTIADPACGTGGFLLSAFQHLNKRLIDKPNAKNEALLRERTFYGADIVPSVVRLCAMNLFLHGLETPDDQTPLVECTNSLERDPPRLFNIVLANPPFGRSSSMKYADSDDDAENEGEMVRRKGFITTSNKQLNFVQHIYSMLETNGTAGIVLPDNVLFEGGVGEIIRRNLLKTCDVHTLVRLPTGIFYAQGVKANILFFDKKSSRASSWTKRLWVYDLRTNLNFTLKTRRMARSDLDELVAVCKLSARKQRVESERFKSFSYEEIVSRDKSSLDIFWLKDDTLETSLNLPAPHILAAKIIKELEVALDLFRSMESQLSSNAHDQKSTKGEMVERATGRSLEPQLKSKRHETEKTQRLIIS
jgi:type I restriction enzyme M protein